MNLIKFCILLFYIYNSYSVLFYRTFGDLKRQIFLISISTSYIYSSYNFYYYDNFNILYIPLILLLCYQYYVYKNRHKYKK
jgi:hypothetical protein